MDARAAAQSTSWPLKAGLGERMAASCCLTAVAEDSGWVENKDLFYTPDSKRLPSRARMRR